MKYLREFSERGFDFIVAPSWEGVFFKANIFKLNSDGTYFTFTYSLPIPTLIGGLACKVGEDIYDLAIDRAIEQFKRDPILDRVDLSASETFSYQDTLRL